MRGSLRLPVFSHKKCSVTRKTRASRASAGFPNQVSMLGKALGFPYRICPTRELLRNPLENA
jgi:hypothetical protein